ncbi:Haloacid dehalogenase-like hydrolase-domain-containing protein [Chaetomium tenue]|uniref:Haloacid dehalogenase-like hydrolase-domain-containing protein n=1 Tax=Chaetomium tenue TaxID=1854479 RepID=A0ACB7PQW0_9PEZI|nr:Haloacid dehalogenase-like hydrolase-domain-containing protein [Chaetomium globosum]
MTTHPDLTAFRALSFDCYGTLIDWETGLASSLSPLTTSLPPQHPWHTNPSLAVARFDHHSNHLSATQPTLTYDANLAEAARLLAAEAREVGEVGDASAAETQQFAADVAAGPGRWPAFPDTVDGLRRLRRFYKLVILSNVDEANIGRAVVEDGPLGGVGGFDAVYTAEAIGSYKPSLANFGYLFEEVRREFGVVKEEGGLLHVARSLPVDHVPAKELGLRSVWIARGGERPEGYGVGGDYEKLRAEGKLGFEWVFQTIGEFADEVERQFAEKEAREKK